MVLHVIHDGAGPDERTDQKNGKPFYFKGLPLCQSQLFYVTLICFVSLLIV